MKSEHYDYLAMSVIYKGPTFAIYPGPMNSPGGPRDSARWAGTMKIIREVWKSLVKVFRFPKQELYSKTESCLYVGSLTECTFWISNYNYIPPRHIVIVSQPVHSKNDSFLRKAMHQFLSQGTSLL